jgi:hypothetical protein
MPILVGPTITIGQLNPKPKQGYPSYKTTSIKYQNPRHE